MSIALHLKELGILLQKASRDLARTIYLVSDEPYRRIVYDGITVPSIFHCYPESILTTFFSKDLSIPGERIGYIAVHPQAAERRNILDALTLCNRTLGFVNAPALMQHILPAAIDAAVDMQPYTRKRDLLCRGLAACGYSFTPPSGTFYLFPKSPVHDDMAFVEALQDQRIIAVPGTAFGCAGYFRLAFCAADETITKAIPGFSRAYLQLA